MKNNRPNIVYIVFICLATLILTFLGVYTGIARLLLTTPAVGRATMLFIVAAMVLFGGVALVVAELLKRKDLEMLGVLLNHLGVVIMLFLDASNLGISVLAGIVLFAFVIFDILGLYLEKKVFKILPFIFAAISLLLLLATGIVGFAYYSSYSFVYVLYFFGYFFLGISIFVISLFRLIASRGEDEVTPIRLSSEQIEELKKLKAKHEAKKISDEEFERKRAEIVG